MALTGKTIGQLTYLQFPTNDTLIPVEYLGDTLHITFSSITYNEGTYSQFVSESNNGILTPGRFYLINDFQTCYDQPNFDYNENPITTGNYKSGSTEPLLLLAISTTGFSPTVYSLLYPNDKITYDITWNTTEVTNSPAKGRITERIDEFNNRTDYDHRAIQFIRYQYIEARPSNEYVGIVSTITSSATEMTVTGTDTLFLSLNIGDYVSFDNTDYKAYQITDITSETDMTVTGLTVTTLNQVKVFPAYTQGYTIYYQNNISTTDFEEYYTFDYGNFNVNNYIGNYSNLYQDIEGTFILANNVFIGSDYRNNTFGNACYNNSFDDNCENNKIGNYFYNNSTDDDFDGNVIGNNFNNNRITSNFQYNRIGENFYNNYLVQNSFYRNNIGNYFSNNEISGGDLQNNEIGNQFQGNKLRNGQYYKNDIGNGFNNNNIYSELYGNLIGNGFAYNDLYCGFFNNVVSDYYGNNNIGDINNPNTYEFYENKIGYSFTNNNISADTYNNIFGNDCSNNIITGETNDNSVGNTFQYNTINDYFNNNKIGNQFKGNVMYQQFSLNNMNSFVVGNNFSGNTYYNNFGTFTFYNDFLGETSTNTWVAEFYGNFIGPNFNNNIFGSNITNNIIGENFQYNNIGSEFYNNTVGDNFGFGSSSSQGNKIGNYFNNNKIGEYFYNNVIQDNFTNNTIGYFFQLNDVKVADLNNVDFIIYLGNINTIISTTPTAVTDGVYSVLPNSTSGHGSIAVFSVTVSGGVVTSVTVINPGFEYNTGDTITISAYQFTGNEDLIITVSTLINPIPIVYTTANSTIFKNSNGVNRLSYYDGSDVLTITNINE